MSLGERIREARERKGLMQTQLAELVEVKSSAVISNWEVDKNKPDADKLVKLCDVLGVSLSYLLNYNPEPALSPEALAIARKYEQLDKYGKKMVETVVDLEIQRRNDEEYERRVAAYGAVHKEAIDQMLEREAKERERLLDEQSDFPERSGRLG